jgi:hypothetical protein
MFVCFDFSEAYVLIFDDIGLSICNFLKIDVNGRFSGKINVILFKYKFLDVDFKYD